MSPLVGHLIGWGTVQKWSKHLIRRSLCCQSILTCSFIAQRGFIIIFLQVTSSAPELDVDFEALRLYGPDPDLMFWKLSFMCARILIHTKDPNHIITAARIMQDIAEATVRDAETAAFAASVRTFQAAVRGLHRANVNYVPYYSKAHISKMLNQYSKKISRYEDKIGRMEDRIMSLQELIKVISQPMLPRDPLLGLLCWCSIFASSHCKIFDGQGPINKIQLQWFNNGDRVPGWYQHYFPPFGLFGSYMTFLTTLHDFLDHLTQLFSPRAVPKLMSYFPITFRLYFG